MKTQINIIENSDFIHKGINTNREYEKIFKSLPNNISELKIKYNLAPDARANKTGNFSNIYFTNKEAVKINRFNMGQVNNWLLNETKKEVANQQLVETLGIYVPKHTGIHLIKKGNGIHTGFTMRDLGDLTIESMKPSEEKSLAILSWANEIKKSKEFLKKQPDMHKKNAIWVPEEKQTYLIDFDIWKIKGVDYSKY